ncbi:hypothetical protein IQ270_07540 [Microcoleus sp. LEGE 07076]|uniref:hypothetical protein n=1 Tax=Microcoleus sp. LEGE 07076 TaxID=915322 RepID=UPI00187F0715|nr:hypothetical protein [Microcoleus sp. LEGE 07076]
MRLRKCQDKCQIYLSFQGVESAGWHENKHPGSKTISLPFKVKIPFPSITLTVAFRAELCSEISETAARQSKLY